MAEQSAADVLMARGEQVPDRGPDFMCSPDQKLRNQIEHAKHMGRNGHEVREHLMELRRQHFEMTGAQGG